jgi:hypothetical protein
LEFSFAQVSLTYFTGLPKSVALQMLGAIKSQDKDQSIHSPKQKEPDINERVIVIARGFAAWDNYDL